MAVDFADYFWGEKHEGFQVLMQNMKASLLASKELGEFVKEASVIQEHNTKAYGKLSRQLGGNLYYGTFSPIIAAMKTSSEKLSQLHQSTLTRINDLLKDILKYNEEMNKKHKQMKDEESATADCVKSLQEIGTLLHKQKEFFKQKVAELEKLKRDNTNSKDMEKAESKVKKAQEDYRNLVDKYSSVLQEFDKKMGTSCKHFQQAETLYLTQMADFMQTYLECIDSTHNEVGKVNLELEQHLVHNSVEKLLETFVLQKYTGLEKPGPIEFSELLATGGPPSDISDRSGNSDKVSVSSLPKKESSGGCPVELVLETDDGVQDLPNTSLPLGELPSPGGDPSPASLPSQKVENDRSPYASLANWSVPGFLKNRKKKERSKKGKGGKEDGTENEIKEIGSDGEERRRSETPTPDQTEEGYSEPPPGPVDTDPWADFHQPQKKKFYSDSDSDSDDEIKKIKIKIRPVTAQTRSATSASVDELQKAIGGIDLMVATLPTKGRSKSVMKEMIGSHTLKYKKRMTPTVDFDGGVKRSQSSNLVSKHSQDLLGLFNAQDPVSDMSGEPPGAESTRLDTSNNSNEVSSILHDIHDLNAASKDEAVSPTSTGSRDPPVRPAPAIPALTLPAWPADPVDPDDTDDMAPPSEPAPAPPSGSPPPVPSSLPPSVSGQQQPWSDAAWTENSKKEEISWATAWEEPVQPALPPKQNARPASVQREKIASSLISLPRPPSRARPEPRLRGTPSPTPTSFLQTTALSLARSDSIGSTGSDGKSSGRSGHDSFSSKFLDSKYRSDSLGSKSDSFSRFETEGLKTGRSGPIMPTPSSESPRRADSATPPSGPAPVLHSFATSRGPSPLTLGGAEVVPLAVAFQEVVHAAFRGRDESRCLVKQLGDMMLSFPAGIVAVLASNPYPAPLQFRIKNAARLESVLPNKQLISKVQNLSTISTLVFEFNMTNLQDLLNKQSQINPHASYFNIDILKYQISPLPGAASCPFQMVSYWKCEDEHTDLRLDFKYNQHAMARPTPLLNLTLAVPVDGGVQNMTSQPKGTWNGESGRALWRFPDLSANQNGGVGAVRARFQLSQGPGSQGSIAAQFNCEGTTLSGVEFELSGVGYRVSLVKRRFVSGKYVSEPDVSLDTNRYAAPSSFDTEY